MELNLLIPALLLAWLLDRYMGDPKWFPHPVVAFGRFIAFCERWWNLGKYRFFRGMLVTIVSVTGVFFIFWYLFQLADGLNIWLGAGLKSIFIFSGLAGTTLIKEGKAVFEKLKEGLEEGRQQVARIVGRDTGNLSKHEIKTATLETLSENLSDGVVAPLFWFAVAGVPGMMAYKMVNTLDSMIGYRNEKYEHFGKFAARLDDVANFFPARMTALLMALCGWSFNALSYIFRYGSAHKSPNAGYPEAALAGILNVQFGGSHNYFGKIVSKPVIGQNPRGLNDNDLIKTIKINRRVEFAMIVLVISSLLFFK